MGAIQRRYQRQADAIKEGKDGSIGRGSGDPAVQFDEHMSGSELAALGIEVK